MDSNDRSWIVSRNRISHEYTLGLNNFLATARHHLGSDGRTLCPCTRCENTWLQRLPTIRAHILRYGMLATYQRWIHHGESLSDEEENDHFEDSSNNDEEDHALRDAIVDEEGRMFFNVDHSIENDVEDESNVNRGRFDKLIEQLNKELYPGSGNLTLLQYVVKLMHIKVLNKWSDKSVNMLLQFEHSILPSGHNLPRSYYEMKKILIEIGLGYHNIDVCNYDCALFYGEYANLLACPVCNHPRYKRNKAPFKRMRYFPLTPRLQRLYSSRHTSEDMRWHAEKRKAEEGVLRHPADGEAWKDFDLTYPAFAIDSRNIRLGLTSDGFNPFGNMSASYSTWPVMVKALNLPPWKMMHQTSYMMCLLIPGPKSPGKDFDIFMRPLIDELKTLWVGVTTYDATSGGMFNLKAVVLWTISDFPAYAYLSGYSTKGHLACPECLENTHFRSIRSKTCYMGSRKWLPSGHRWRRSKEFDGFVEFDEPSRPKCGDEIVQLLDQLPSMTSGKAPNNSGMKRKFHDLHPLRNWSNRSIFFELEYWSKLKLRHNLDVMHIEKNVCDNIIHTLLGVEKKSKDTVKARMDLEDLGIRKELWLQKSSSGVLKKPHASYTFTKEEKICFLDFLKSVRLPDGYASNISRCVTSDRKLTNLKTHDSHILFQNLLPIGIVGLLCKDARVAIIELSNFFRRLCARTLLVAEIQELKKGIVVILCKLEKIFPPSFFTIMVHLCIHLPDQALLGGPVASRWMYSAERCLGTYKRYVRNTAFPEGSIAEAYVVDEALTFLSLYIKGLETKFTRPERNIDDVICNESSNFALFKARLRCFGTSQLKFLTTQSNALQWYILNNCHEDIKSYLDEHMNILKENFSNDLEQLQSRTFPTWFKLKMEKLRHEGSIEATDDMYSLALGPFDRYTSWTSCIVNGVRFHSQCRDDKLHTQNCGISVPSNHDGEEVDFYGVLLEVMELSYILDRKVVVFRCKWYNTDKRMRNIHCENDLTSIKISSEWYANDPYILATQAQQVFYLADTKRDKNWRFVQKISRRHIWDVPIVDAIHEVSTTPYHESNTLSSTFVASENDIDDIILVRNDIEPTNCDEDEFMNDVDQDNESEDVEPTYESEDKEASEEEEDDGVDD